MCVTVYVCVCVSVCCVCDDAPCRYANECLHLATTQNFIPDRSIVGNSLYESPEHRITALLCHIVC